MTPRQVVVRSTDVATVGVLVTLTVVAALLVSPARASSQEQAPVQAYVDVCDDGSGAALDLRRSILDARPSGATAFVATACRAFADADVGTILWTLDSDGDGETDYEVEIALDAGMLRIVARTVEGVVTHAGPAQRVSDGFGVAGDVPDVALGGNDEFTFRMSAADSEGRRDEIPESHEPAARFPVSCGGVVASRLTVAADSGEVDAAVRSVRRAGLVVTRKLPGMDVFEVARPPGDPAAWALERLPGVASVAVQQSVELFSVTPDDPAYPSQWALPAIRAPIGWQTRTGSALSVAVVDDGIDASRTDLSAKVAGGHDSRFDVPLPEGANSDRGGHGTAVTSVLAATGDNGIDLAGVDWSATVVPYRVTDAAGCGSDFDMADAVVRATDRDVDVIHFSGGVLEDSRPLGDAIRHALRSGISVVAAVGNEKLVGNRTTYPAGYDGVIGVGATTRDDTIAAYSNTGSLVHVVAPGGDASGSASEDILVLGERGRIAIVAGTSFAAPQVTGAALLYLAGNPGADPATVSVALANAARDLGPAGRDDTYGYGLLDLATLLLTERACPAAEVPEDGFGDVPGSSVHEFAVDCLVWWDIAEGRGDGRFVPAEAVTRAQMASFLARALEAAGQDLPIGRDHFTDDGGSVHEDNINRLATAGVVEGVSASTYAPGRSLTRAQMASLLVRAYEHATGTTLRASRDHFDDDEGNVHEDNINKAASAGFATGTTATTYEPDASVRRDQLASFVTRMLDRFVREGLAAPPE